jgi:hypothetical protein
VNTLPYIVALVGCGLALLAQAGHAFVTSAWFRERRRRARFPVAIVRVAEKPLPESTPTVAMLGMSYAVATQAQRPL